MERLGPARPERPDFAAADAFVWQAETERFLPVPEVNRVPLPLLKGIDRMRDTLLANTERFAEGLPANNALLWGARGMGKSSLVKAVHRTFPGLKLVEIHREDIAALPQLLGHLRAAPEHRFILFCDDLSFEAVDTSYKSLKAVLEGGIEGRPANVLLYATSNRRHLMPREMVENERSTAINPSEAVEEKLSLSDRFGLWIGFHNCSQDDYLAMVRGYADALPARRCAKRTSTARRSNGRADAAAARAASPGNSFRTWRDVSARRSSRPAPPCCSYIWSDRRGASPCAARNALAAG